MQPYTINIFILQFIVYSLINLFFYSKKSNKLIDKFNKKIIPFILFIQIIFILIINYSKYEIGDVMLFSGAGYFLRNKVDFYFIDVNHTQYPFFPFLIFIHAVLNLLTESLNFLTFSSYLKLLILIPLLYFLSVKIFKLNSKKSKLNGYKKQFQFLTSPIVFCIILLHGQIDIILISFLILSFNFLFKKDYKNIILGSIFYSLSILSKTWSIFFSPLILKFQKNIYKTILTGLITLLGIFTNIFIYTRYVYGSGFKVVLPAILKAGGPIGNWGIPLVLNIFNVNTSFFEKNNLYIFIILFVLTQLLIFFSKSKNIYTSSVLNILSFYLILPNWGVQYLFWITPFLFLDKKISEKNKNTFLLLSSTSILLNYMNIIKSSSFISLFYIKTISLILWIFCLYWFIKELRNSYKNNL